MTYNKDKVTITIGGVEQTGGYSPITTITKERKWYKNLTNVHGITEVVALFPDKECKLRFHDLDGMYYNMIKNHKDSIESPFSFIDAKGDKIAT
jgi:hypothetical protein